MKIWTGKEIYNEVYHENHESFVDRKYPSVEKFIRLEDIRPLVEKIREESKKVETDGYSRAWMECVLCYERIGKCKPETCALKALEDTIGGE